MSAIYNSLADSELAKQLQEGKVGIIPTDTVYGIVCRAADLAAVERLYALKKRENKPGTLIAADIDQLTELGIKRSYVKAVEQFWPGAVSVVIPFSDPDGNYLRQNLPDIAVRIPDNKNLSELLKQAGPLLTSSANQPGEPPANNLKEALAYFDDKVDFYVDGPDLKDKLPSTVIRIVDDAVEVLRPGAVSIENNGIAK